MLREHPTAVLKGGLGRAVAMFVIAIAAPMLPAQEPGPDAPLGVVRGVVYDSLAGRPLPQARVWTADGRRTTIADEDGRFQLDSIAIAAEPVMILATHPAADSVGLSTLAAAVRVTAGDTAHVTIAIPSYETLRRAACAGLPDAGDAEGGVLFGTIRDATTGQPIPAAVATLSWQSVQPQPSSPIPTISQMGLEASADASGAFYACGLPTSSELLVQARGTDTTASSGTIAIMIGARRILRRDLLVNASGRATIVSTVVDSAGRPLPGARVSFDGQDAVLAGGGGNAVFRDIAAGTHQLGARHIGFSPTVTPVDVAPGDTARVTLRLDPVPQRLAAVRVDGLLAEIEARREQGRGYVMTGEELERAPTMDFTIPMVPAVRIERKGGIFSTKILMRSRLGKDECEPTVFLDGDRSTVEELYLYRPQELIGVEVYPDIADAPAQYLRPSDYVSNCGIILAWTKR